MLLFFVFFVLFRTFFAFCRTRWRVALRSMESFFCAPHLFAESTKVKRGWGPAGSRFDETKGEFVASRKDKKPQNYQQEARKSSKSIKKYLKNIRNFKKKDQTLKGRFAVILVLFALFYACFLAPGSLHSCWFSQTAHFSETQEKQKKTWKNMEKWRSRRSSRLPYWFVAHGPPLQLRKNTKIKKKHIRSQVFWQRNWSAAHDCGTLPTSQKHPKNAKNNVK